MCTQINYYWMQFVFGPNGEVGLTYEHSPAEGQPIAVMMDHIINYWWVLR